MCRFISSNMAGYHVLTVWGNSLGIDSDSTNQLFTMLKRFHDHVEATGIGLYMSKNMIENAGGRTEVEKAAWERALPLRYTLNVKAYTTGP